MAQRESPAAVKRQGFESGKAVQAISFFKATSSQDHLQEPAAVRHLMTRFGMLPATAQAVAEANAWGCR